MTEAMGDRPGAHASDVVVPAPRGNTPWLERLVARVTRAGTTHESLRARNDQAASLFREGRHTDAEREFAETQARSSELLGAEHADTLVAAGNLAAAHIAAGNPEPAVGLLEGAVTDRARLRGPLHPSTLDARHGLGVALRDAGNASAACEVLRSTLADRARTLGPDHPDTLGSHSALAAALAALEHADVG